MTEKNIFDSIREKSKSFPELLASNIVHSPSTEALILARKRSREKQFESYSEVEVLKELGENVPGWSVAKSYVEPSEAEQNAHNIGNYQIQKNHITAKNSDTSNFMEDTGIKFYLKIFTLTLSLCLQYETINPYTYFMKVGFPLILKISPSNLLLKRQYLITSAKKLRIFPS